MNRWSILVLGAVVLVCTVVSPETRGDMITFDLIPASGAISGPPGSTIGWGYSITNESASDWLVTVGLNADSFLNGTPSLLFDFPALAPTAAKTMPLDEATGAGLYMLTWDSSAPVGFVNSGTFVLNAQWWDGDPLNGGSYMMDALDTSQVYSATVSQTTGVVPEPSTWLLLLTGFGMLACRKVLSSGRS